MVPHVVEADKPGPRVQQLIFHLIDIAIFKNALQQCQLLRRRRFFTRRACSTSLWPSWMEDTPDTGGTIEANSVMLNAAELLQGAFWCQSSVTRP